MNNEVGKKGSCMHLRVYMCVYVISIYGLAASLPTLTHRLIVLMSKLNHCVVIAAVISKHGGQGTLRFGCDLASSHEVRKLTAK